MPTTLEMCDHAVVKGLLVCNAFRDKDLDLPPDVATLILDQLHHQAAQSIINLWYRHVKTKVDLAKDVIEYMSVPNSPYNNDKVDFDKMFDLIHRVNIMINFAVDDVQWWSDKLVNLMSQVSNVKALCQDIDDLEYSIAHNLIISRIHFIEKQIQFHNRKVDAVGGAWADLDTQMIDWHMLLDFNVFLSLVYVNGQLHKDLADSICNKKVLHTQIRNKLLKKYSVFPEWLFYWWSRLDECVSIHETDIATRADYFLLDCDPNIFDDELWISYVMSCRSI